MMAPEGGPIVITVSVGLSQYDPLMGTMWLHLLQNDRADVSLPDTNQIREQCRCATCSLF